MLPLVAAAAFFSHVPVAASLSAAQEAARTTHRWVVADLSFDFLDRADDPALTALLDRLIFVRVKRDRLPGLEPWDGENGPRFAGPSLVLLDKESQPVWRVRASFAPGETAKGLVEGLTLVPQFEALQEKARTLAATADELSDLTRLYAARRDKGRTRETTNALLGVVGAGPNPAAHRALDVLANLLQTSADCEESLPVWEEAAKRAADADETADDLLSLADTYIGLLQGSKAVAVCDRVSKLTGLNPKHREAVRILRQNAKLIGDQSPDP